MRSATLSLSMALFFVLCISPLPASAQKERLIVGSPAEIFGAALQVVKDHYTVVGVDREDLILSFRTPAGMRAANGYDVTASVEPRPNGCGGQNQICSEAFVRLRVSKRHAVFTWGGGDAACRDFFHWLDERLNASSTKKDGSRPLR